MRFAVLATVLAVCLTSCVGAPKAQRAVPRPPPIIRPIAQPPAPAAIEWIDRPATPGDWTYEQKTGGSSARFGAAGQNAVFMLSCYQAGRTILVSRAVAVSEGATAQVVLRATSAARSFAAQRAGTALVYLVAAIPLAEVHLDALAFSRGRFMVQVRGEGDLILPASPEISRVIEDCRAK